MQVEITLPEVGKPLRLRERFGYKGVRRKLFERIVDNFPKNLLRQLVREPIDGKNFFRGIRVADGLKDARAVSLYPDPPRQQTGDVRLDRAQNIVGMKPHGGNLPSAREEFGGGVARPALGERPSGRRRKFAEQSAEFPVAELPALLRGQIPRGESVQQFPDALHAKRM